MYDTPSNAELKEINLTLKYAKDKLKRSSLSKLKAA